MQKTIDWTKPIQTRDGRKARVISTSANVNYYNDMGAAPQQVIAVFETGSRDGSETVGSFFLDGRFTTVPAPHDLENCPETFDRFLNVYPDGVGDMRITVEDANNAIGNDRRVALYKFTFDSEGVLKCHERLQ